MRARKFPQSDNSYAGIKDVTATLTFTKEDFNKQLKYNSTTAIIGTLPPVGPANKGAKILVQLLQLPGSGGHQIAPASVDKIFASFATSTAASDGKKLYFGTDNAGAGDKIGDFIELQSDGVDGWHQTAGQGSFFREA